MVSIRTRIRPEEIRHAGQHVLFVEGVRDSVDPKVLNELFGGSIRIEALGPSLSVRSVAEALYPSHPTYYFLIDRDHYENEFVDSCWQNFPDSETHNLLVWRRREIENYFLEPSYLSCSDYCRVTKGELEQTVVGFANERLFLDAANQVVTSIREELKQNWIKLFSDPAQFPSKEAALHKLKHAREFERHRANTEQMVSTGELERRFHEYLLIMTGGEDRLSLGTGEWLKMVQGKKILAQVINSACFQVTAADNTSISGPEKIHEVAKDLLRKEPSVQPEDFIHLKSLIETRIAAGSH